MTGWDCDTVRSVREQRLSRPTGTGTRVLVIGDSYAQGFGLADPDRSWPHYLPGRVTVDGYSGSGFATPSHCGGGTYVERARRLTATRPEVVIAQGGYNDVRAPARRVERAAIELVRLFPHARVAIVGPPYKQGREDLRLVDRALARAAARTGAQYVRAYAWPVRFEARNGHPTAASQRLIGTDVARAVLGRHVAHE